MPGFWRYTDWFGKDMPIANLLNVDVYYYFKSVERVKYEVERDHSFSVVDPNLLARELQKLT
jgi:hypothetical protein